MIAYVLFTTECNAAGSDKKWFFIYRLGKSFTRPQTCYKHVLVHVCVVVPSTENPDHKRAQKSSRGIRKPGSSAGIESSPQQGFEFICGFLQRRKYWSISYANVLCSPSRSPISVQSQEPHLIMNTAAFPSDTPKATRMGHAAQVGLIS